MDKFKQEKDDEMNLAGKKIELTIHPNFIEVIDPKVLKQQATNYLLYKLQELEKVELEQQRTMQNQSPKIIQSRTHEILDDQFVTDQQSQPANQTYQLITECAPSRMTRVESQSSPKKGSQQELPIQIIEEDHQDEMAAGNQTIDQVSNMKTRMEKGCSGVGKDATMAPIERMEVDLNVDGVGDRDESADRNSQPGETDEMTKSMPSTNNE